jgi:hypothetical protein
MCTPRDDCGWAFSSDEARESGLARSGAISITDVYRGDVSLTAQDAVEVDEGERRGHAGPIQEFTGIQFVAASPRRARDSLCE